MTPKYYAFTEMKLSMGCRQIRVLSLGQTRKIKFFFIIASE